MSNELLMELFEYYDLYSLFYSFGSLNSRISNVIYHCDVSVDFDKIKPSDFIDFIHDIIPKFNTKKFRSLHSSIPYKTEVIANDKSLLYFTHIRSLSLDDIKLDVVKCMISRINFPRLERLSINEYQTKYSETQPVLKHFLDSNRYKYLRIYKDPSGITEEVTSVLLIEYVTFFGVSVPCHFLNFLNQSPHLKYIKAKLSFSENTPKPVFLSPIPCYNTLTHLNLALCDDICMETIAYLLKCVPRIRHLKVVGYSNTSPESTDPKFWELYLSTYLLDLKRLSLSIYVRALNPSSVLVWNYLMDKAEIIEQIKKSNYWSSHRWKTSFNSSRSTFTDDNIYRAKFSVD
jgi:hypothetical protein